MTPSNRRNISSKVEKLEAPKEMLLFLYSLAPEGPEGGGGKMMG
jgi:hypothetical protein